MIYSLLIKFYLLFKFIHVLYYKESHWLTIFVIISENSI